MRRISYQKFDVGMLGAGKQIGKKDCFIFCLVFVYSVGTREQKAKGESKKEKAIAKIRR